MDFKWKIKAEQLQEQLDAAQKHASQLEQILDACETANAKHLARIDQLEQLVKYMYRCYVLGHDWGVWGAPEQQWVEERMADLGLLDGEDNA